MLQTYADESGSGACDVMEADLTTRSAHSSGVTCTMGGAELHYICVSELGKKKKTSLQMHHF